MPPMIKPGMTKHQPLGVEAKRKRKGVSGDGAGGEGRVTLSWAAGGVPAVGQNGARNEGAEDVADAGVRVPDAHHEATAAGRRDRAVLV